MRCANFGTYFSRTWFSRKRCRAFGSRLGRLLSPQLGKRHTQPRFFAAFNAQARVGYGAFVVHRLKKVDPELLAGQKTVLVLYKLDDFPVKRAFAVLAVRVL
jgi:hypothetical protein